MTLHTLFGWLLSALAVEQGAAHMVTRRGAAACDLDLGGDTFVLCLCFCCPVLCCAVLFPQVVEQRMLSAVTSSVVEEMHGVLPRTAAGAVWALGKMRFEAPAFLEAAFDR
jgi:hypothetical protein